MDDPAIAIVQTPQFFRESPAQTWIENAAGAIQEVFYRSIQVARDRFGAAICVGTSAVYRRAALEPQGGPTLIPYAEDVHTGLDVRRAGWSLVYLPVVLSTGICPDNLDAFVRQQYRWCTGNAGIVFSRRLWSCPDDASRPGSPTSPASSTTPTPACSTFFGPAHPDRHAGVPARPGPAAELRHPAPGHVLRFVLYPLWHRCRLRAVGLAARRRPGLGARLLHLGQRPGQDDELASDPDAGQPLRRFRLWVIGWSGGTALLWAGPGHLADGYPGFGCSSRSCCSSACSTSPWSSRVIFPGRQSRMKSRLVMLMALLVAAAVVAAIDRVGHASPCRQPPVVHAPLPPGPPPTWVSTSRVAARLSSRSPSSPQAAGTPARTWSATTAAGRSPSSHRSPSMLRSHGVIPFVQIDPTFASISGDRRRCLRRLPARLRRQRP